MCSLNFDGTYRREQERLPNILPSAIPFSYIVHGEKGPVSGDIDATMIDHPPSPKPTEEE